MPLKREKALLIVNPRAGKQGAAKHLFTIISELSKRYSVTVHLTEESDDARTIAATVDGYDVVICCGGDGTLSQFIDGYPTDRKQLTLGYIPMGTSNDTAATLNIPKIPMNAARKICTGEPVAHDLGVFDGRKFIYIASFGAFTKSSYATPQEAKNALGHFAYVIESMFELSEIKEESVTVECDGEIIKSDRVCFLAVTNATAVGGGAIKLPRRSVNLRDGKMELLMINLPDSLTRLTEMLAKLTDSDYDDPDIMLTSGSHFVIETMNPVAWTLDGDDAGSHSRVEITVQKGAINIIR